MDKLVTEDLPTTVPPVSLDPFCRGLTFNRHGPQSSPGLPDPFLLSPTLPSPTLPPPYVSLPCPDEGQVGKGTVGPLRGDLWTPFARDRLSVGGRDRRRGSGAPGTHPPEYGHQEVHTTGLVVAGAGNF